MPFEPVDLLHIPVSLLNTLAAILIYTGFLERKYKVKALYIIAYSVFFVVNLFISMFFLEYIIAFTILAYIIYPVVLYSGPLSQRLICGGLFTAYSFVSECLTVVVISYIFGYTYDDMLNNTVPFYIGAFISAIILLCFAIVIVKRRKVQLSPLPSKHHIALLLIVWLCVGLSYSDILLLEHSGNPANLTYVFSEIAIAVMSVLVYLVFESYQVHAEQKRHNALLERQLRQEEEHFKLIDEQQSEIVSIKHDMVNHLTSVNKLLSDKHYDEATKYLNEYFTQASSIMTKPITGKPSVDALISEKIAIAERENIQFTIETNKLSEININPYHLNIILSNAIDNAIEACRVLPKSIPRNISLGIKTEGDNLCLRIVNPSMKPEFNADGLPVSSKKDTTYHGLGLSTITKVAESYGGTILCKFENDMFSLYVQLMNNPAEDCSK